MPTLIACLIAGICLTGFLTIWFTTAHKELSVKQSNLADLEEQLRLHERLSGQTRDGPDAQSAAGMLETSRMLYHEAAKDYNRILLRPMNRFPALVLGFRAVKNVKKRTK